MKVFLALLCFCFIACNNDSVTQVQFSNKKGIDPKEAVSDSMQLTSLKFDKGDTPISKATKIRILYPRTTKEVEWYSIGHAPTGTGLLTVTCADGSIHPVLLESIEAVSAISSLMQAAYIRIDTISKEIYSYKAALPDTIVPRRPF